MLIHELRPNTAFQVNDFEYEGKKFIGISRLYKKKGDTNWSMGKSVAIPHETQKDKECLLAIIKELKTYVK